MTAAGSYRGDRDRTTWPVWRKALRALLDRFPQPLDLQPTMRFALRRKLHAASGRPGEFQAAICDALTRNRLSSCVQPIAALDVSMVSALLHQASDALSSDESLASATDALPRQLRLFSIDAGTFHTTGIAILDAIASVTEADDDDALAAKAIHTITANLTRRGVDDRRLPPDAYPLA